MQRFATVDGDPHTRSKPLPHILGPPSASTQEVPHQRPCPPTPLRAIASTAVCVRMLVDPTRARARGDATSRGHRTTTGAGANCPLWRARPQLPIVAGHPPHGCACPPSPPSTNPHGHDECVRVASTRARGFLNALVAHRHRRSAHNTLEGLHGISSFHWLAAELGPARSLEGTLPHSRALARTSTVHADETG